MMSSMEDSLSQEFKDVQGNVMPVRPVLARWSMKLRSLSPSLEDQESDVEAPEDVQGNVMPVRPVLARRSMKLRSLSPSLEESVSPKGYFFQRISSWFRAQLNLLEEGFPTLSLYIGFIVSIVVMLYRLRYNLPPKFDFKAHTAHLNLWKVYLSILFGSLTALFFGMIVRQNKAWLRAIDYIFDKAPLDLWEKCLCLLYGSLATFLFAKLVRQNNSWLRAICYFIAKVFDSKPLFKERNVLPPEYDSIIDKETEASERLSRPFNLNSQGTRLFYLKAHPFRMWKLGKCIGAGAFGKVYECSIPRENYGGLCAVKIVKIEPQYTRSRKEVMLLKNEINVLKEIRHNRVVAYFESAEKDNHLHLFMELMTGGSLSDRIKKKKVLSERESRKYAKQILEGVSFLHSIEIIHRDIKGSNVLLDKHKNVKLADFGLSKIIQKIGSKTNLLSHCGTPYWMAPEILWGKGYGRKADIWSVGCTVVEMLTGNPPLSDLEPTAAMFRIGSMPTEPNLPKDISKATKDLITATLTWDPKERPWSNDLLDKFFQSAVGIFVRASLPDRCVSVRDVPIKD